MKLAFNRNLLTLKYLVPVSAHQPVISKRLCDHNYDKLGHACDKRKCLHTSTFLSFLDARPKDLHEKEKQLVVHQSHKFDEVAQHERNKETFHKVLKVFLQNNETYRRGHVEMIYAALDQMKMFGVQRDLESYKKLVELFPKQKMIPQNTWQIEFMHYPKQQQCCIDILDRMEHFGVIPDDDMGYRLLAVFGPKAHVFRKYRRMMYWMPKFRWANPYYVPFELPKDDIELAKFAIKRMAVDVRNTVSVFQTNELENYADDTYIVSGQSPEQRVIIDTMLKRDEPVFVEGGFTTWLRQKSLTYFVLKGHCTDRYQTFKTKDHETTDEEMFKWSIFEEESPKALVVPPSSHEQEDGTVLAHCITGTSSKDSLASWVKFLEREIPALSEIPVIFLLRSPENELEVYNDKKEEKSDVSVRS